MIRYRVNDLKASCRSKPLLLGAVVLIGNERQTQQINLHNLLSLQLPSISNPTIVSVKLTDIRFCNLCMHTNVSLGKYLKMIVLFLAGATYSNDNRSRASYLSETTHWIWNSLVCFSILKCLPFFRLLGLLKQLVKRHFNSSLIRPRVGGFSFCKFLQVSYMWIKIACFHRLYLAN